MEVRIYDTYETFVNNINSGKEENYALTTKIPFGVTTTFGETELPIKNGLLAKLRPYKEERVVICVGDCSNACGLLAINEKKLKELGGKLGTF